MVLIAGAIAFVVIRQFPSQKQGNPERIDQMWETMNQEDRF
jgi:hypothetical protein